MFFTGMLREKSGSADNLTGMSMKLSAARSLIAFAACLALTSCCTTVTIPTDQTKDQMPVITVDAFPVDSGDVEQQNTTTSGTLKASRGKLFMISVTAQNAVGGVSSLATTVTQSGQTLYHASTSQAKSASGSACTTLSLIAAGKRHRSPMKVTMTAPVTVTSTATNFSGMTTTTMVTYVPTDLQVTVTASPTVIGYQQAPSSTLTWSVLYGVPPYTMGFSPKVIDGSLANTTSAPVQPSTTTTYLLTVTDQVTTQVGKATVSVALPPPPPTINFSVFPNDGYNCLGTTDTIQWTVGNCSVPTCNVELHGQGVGYASALAVSLTHLPAVSGYSINPPDVVNFYLTATSCSVCSAKSPTFQVSIAPPNTCGAGSKTPALMTFYFAVTGPNGCFGTIAVVSDSQNDAETQALKSYGTGYSVSPISADDFNSGKGC
jgi:hypothetical protein